ncbi:hypothetical protein GE061_009972 [Apolygus lucorum]|uniref:PHLPP-like RA domain-containing protein n=1 Tax=Apolygus lucorum TaxID=248454 RepID=A0A8S9Y1S4_APOLU|nr:hypothetical protein GE061_009972 [Apolygus lucorum]
MDQLGNMVEARYDTRRGKASENESYLSPLWPSNEVVDEIRATDNFSRRVVLNNAVIGGDDVMKSEVTVGRGCGWIRVGQEPSSAGTLVYLNLATEVCDVTRDLLLPLGQTIWVQYGGDEPRPLAPSEKPLVVQNDFLQRLGYSDSSRRARLGIDPDLRFLISFHTGPKWFGRGGEVWLLKGLVLPQWRKKIITLKNGLMIIQSADGGDWGREAVRVEGVEAADGPRGGRSVIKVTSSGNKSLYLGFDRPWQQKLWNSWLNQERGGKEGQYASRGLVRVPRNIGRCPTLDLSDNRLSEASAPSSASSDDDDDGWSGLAEVSGLSRLNLSSNGLQTVPQEVWTHLGLVSLNLSHNSLTNLPPSIRLHK